MHQIVNELRTKNKNTFQCSFFMYAKISKERSPGCIACSAIKGLKGELKLYLIDLVSPWEVGHEEA